MYRYNLLKKFILIACFSILIINPSTKVYNYDSFGSEKTTTSTDIILTKLGSITVSGSYCGIEVRDDILYICDHEYGLQIYNVSNKNNPIFISKTNDYGTYHGFEIDYENKLAFLACLDEGLVIFNITNLSIPTRIGSYFTGLQEASEVTISTNKLAYVSEFEKGLEVFNVSNPTKPILINNYSDEGGSFNVQIYNNYLFLDVNFNKLIILDINQNLMKVGQYSDSGQVRYFYIEDGIAFLATWSSGLKILNVTDVNNPKLLGKYSIGQEAIAVHKSGDFAFIAQFSLGLQIYNVSDLIQPKLLSTYSDDGGVIAVFAQNEYIYVAMSGSNLRILKIENQSTLSEISTTEQSSNISSQKVSGFNQFYFIAIIFVFMAKKRKF